MHLRISSRIPESIALGIALIPVLAHPADLAPLQIQEQGSFLVGGKTITNPGTFDPYKPTPDGQTFSGDHAYVFYQVPVKPRKYPLILWLALASSPRRGKRHRTDGRGIRYFSAPPLQRLCHRSTSARRRGPRHGGATIKPVPDEQNWFGVFRIGIWPNYFPGVQFSQDRQALDQYFRQMTPEHRAVRPRGGHRRGSQTPRENRSGHSRDAFTGRRSGWVTAIKSANVRGIVAYEPGSNFVFPEGEVPPPQPSSSGAVEALAIPAGDFKKLTRFPIVIYYGDNIPKEPDTNPGQDGWRARLAIARLWRDAVNRHGGDVDVAHLPEIGIRGTGISRFPIEQFADRRPEVEIPRELQLD